MVVLERREIGRRGGKIVLPGPIRVACYEIDTAVVRSEVPPHKERLISDGEPELADPQGGAS